MADGMLFDDSVGRPPVDTWTVGELSAQLARLLASAFPDDVWVSGQIRNLKRSSVGHVYFDLAEPAEAGATPATQLPVTLLAPERMLVNEQLKRAGGAVRMTDGIEVRIEGRVRWFAPRGIVQLRMHGIDPTFTLGRLEDDRTRLLALLAADDLLARNARVPMPLVPLRVGLVTSVGSAAHADVLATFEASGLGFRLRQVHARTQGPECGPQVARALERLAGDGVDVVLVVRGGGARTDLAGFDTEQIARAIAAMPVPVLTGIGHEIDRSIADEVAHTAHKTPTAAAAEVVERVRAFLGRVDDRAASLHRSVTRSLQVATRRIDERSERARRVASRSLDRHDARIDAAARRVPAAAHRSLDVAASQLDRPARALGGHARRTFELASRDLDAVAARVQAHDPAHALARGWSITTAADGTLVRSVADAPAGTRLITRVADGQVHSTVSIPDPHPGEEPQP